MQPNIDSANAQIQKVLVALGLWWSAKYFTPWIVDEFKRTSKSESFTLDIRTRVGGGHISTAQLNYCEASARPLYLTFNLICTPVHEISIFSLIYGINLKFELFELIKVSASIRNSSISVNYMLATILSVSSLINIKIPRQHLTAGGKFNKIMQILRIRTWGMTFF